MTIPEYKPSFSHMKAKYQNLIREESYFSQLLLADEMMFDYQNLPESINPKFLEDYLNISGACGICKSDDEYLICPYGARNGELNQYGLGEKLIGNTMNGKTVSGTIGEDCVLIYNNSAYMPQFDLMIDSDMLAQIEKSCGINVLFSRIAPVYSAPNDATQNALKLIIANVLEGNLETVTSSNVFDALNLSDGGIKMLDVTHPEKIQYIQYLSEYYDAVLRRHFSRRGLTLRTGTKAAQQSRDEINGMDSVSWYNPVNKLIERRRGFAEFNRIFDENVVVDFSEVWKQEYEAYKLRILKQDADAEMEMKGVADNDGDAEPEADSDENNSGLALSE